MRVYEKRPGMATKTSYFRHLYYTAFGRVYTNAFEAAKYRGINGLYGFNRGAAGGKSAKLELLITTARLLFDAGG